MRFEIDPRPETMDNRPMINRAGWIRLVASAASGLLVALLFPPFHGSALAWVAMIPVLVTLGTVEGTPLAGRKFVDSIEFVRTIAVARILIV